MKDKLDLSDFDFTFKNIIVTGATSGLGFKIVTTFLELGASVCFCGLQQEKVNAVMQELYPTYGEKIIGLKADVSKIHDVKNLILTGIKKFNRIDLLVNNAAIYGPKGFVEENSVEEWVQTLNVNLMSVLHTTQMIIPHFKEVGGGKIINISGGGEKPLPRFSAYATSKASIIKFTEIIAEECKEYNIQINSIAPGAMNTQLLSEALEAGPEAIGEAFYNKCLDQQSNGGTDPQLAANLCVYLTSVFGNKITGKNISAPWDDWTHFHEHLDELCETDIYTYRRKTK